MSNTKTWPDPDAANAATGPSVSAVYLLDPTTQKPVNPATSSSAPAADTVATGTLSAAQATVGTPVVGGTVSITLGSGQATVEAALTGTFNAGTTILFEGTEDSGVTTNWFTMFGLDTSVQNPTNISSIAGGASKLIRIPSMGYSQVRLRANPFAGGDSVSVRLVASVAGSGGSGGAVTVTNANANGQATMANSAPVVVASDQSKLPTKAAAGDFADGAIATLGLEADAAAAADTSTASYISLFKRLLAKFPTIGPQAKAASVSVTFATDIPTLTTAGTVTEANSGSIKTDLDTVVTNTNKLIAPSVNSGTIDATTQRTVPGGAATGTKSNVASSASSVTILASNTSRKGAVIYNDSTQVLYLDLSGGTATSSSYSVQLASNAYFELPGPTIYNGAITGIWASANGNARVTELT